MEVTESLRRRFGAVAIVSADDGDDSTLGAYGSRVALVLKADIRPGHVGELTAKVDRLEAALAEGSADRAAVEPARGTLGGC